MGTPPAPIPPNEELRDLLARAVALEYLRSRDYPTDKSQETKTKPVWLQLFESAGFAALVTVLLGGIAGAIITEASRVREEPRLACRRKPARP